MSKKRPPCHDRAAQDSLAPAADVPSPAGPWRFLEQGLDDDQLRQLRQTEFAGGIGAAREFVSRREFLTLMGASLALASLPGCQAPSEEIVPYVDAEQVTPGRPKYYATTLTLAGLATGVLVEQHLGRPTKVEGNPDHPASLGATDIFAQASVLSLYDPDRSKQTLHAGRASSWDEALAALRGMLDEQRARQGAGLRIVTEGVTSPTLAAQLEGLLDELPEAVWHQFEPAHSGAARAGTRLIAGEERDSVFDLREADVIVALDSDFLNSGPGCLRYARQFADRRRVWTSSPEQATMNRLYAAGPTPTPTGASADHWLPLRARDVEPLLRELAARLEVPSGPGEAPPVSEKTASWVEAIAADLQEHRGRSLIVVGDSQPAAVHALARAVNEALGNVNQTVRYRRPVHARPFEAFASLAELKQDLDAGRVGAIVFLGCNPVYGAPADLPIAEQLTRVPFSLHLGQYYDETARRCQWHVPESHELERWGDSRAFDGTPSLVQPLILPLYESRTALDVVAALRGNADTSAYELVREHWRSEWDESDAASFERRWYRALHDGLIADAASPAEEATSRDAWWDDVEAGPADTAPPDSLEVVFRTDPTIYDGRFANNAWLQELPKPLTQITWENVAAMSPATAERLGVRLEIGDNGGDVLVDQIRLEYRGRAIVAPAWIMPGHADDCVTLYLGYGRSAAGPIGDGIGYDANRLRTSERPWFDAGLSAQTTGDRVRLAVTQLHHLMHGRDLVRSGTLEEYRESPQQPARSDGKSKSPSLLPILDSRPETSGEEQPPSLYPEYAYLGHKWGMVIDQTACLGCSACVIACQAENNVPVVGKEEVSRGREMHWLRVDSYFTGEVDGRLMYSQPVPCMHCEKAPCEVVCPVNATTHSDEGLNEMTYNRCVGTRYCSNNCPYKVRRFNFFEYANWEDESLRPLRNPDVSVRSLGVMEKCTYCVQRINTARSYAGQDDRQPVENRAGQWIKPIRDEELLTACQAACPTRAITFGDLNSRDSEVARMRYEQPLNYGLLNDELGTQPRTTYLAALRNPNPALVRGPA